MTVTSIQPMRNVLTLSAFYYGPLAQRLEQPAHNRLVVGSSPTWPTLFYNRSEEKQNEKAARY